FVALRHPANPTREEGEFLIDDSNRRKPHIFILVTTTFPTRRARRVFLSVLEHKGNGMTMHIVATPDRDYDPRSWWKTRQGWKVAFFEWTKTITSLAGI